MHIFALLLWQFFSAIPLSAQGFEAGDLQQIEREIRNTYEKHKNFRLIDIKTIQTDDYRALAVIKLQSRRQKSIEIIRECKIILEKNSTRFLWACPD